MRHRSSRGGGSSSRQTDVPGEAARHRDVAELYHASGATLQEQTGLVAVWEATYGMLDALLVTGLVILPFGMLAHGTAMVGAPGFGARLGGMGVALGVAGIVTATALLVEVTPIAAVGVFALIVFHLAVGVRTHRLARTPQLGEA